MAANYSNIISQKQWWESLPGNIKFLFEEYAGLEKTINYKALAKHAADHELDNKINDCSFGIGYSKSSESGKLKRQSNIRQELANYFVSQSAESQAYAECKLGTSFMGYAQGIAKFSGGVMSSKAAEDFLEKMTKPKVDASSASLASSATASTASSIKKGKKVNLAADFFTSSTRAM
jgi:hypothetical protein